MLADPRRRGVHKHSGGGDLAREPLHGECEAGAAMAMADEGQPVVLGAATTASNSGRKHSLNERTSCRRAGWTPAGR